MMKTNRFLGLCLLVIGALLTTACAPVDERQTPQTSCASLDYIPGARVRSWQQEGVTVIAQIYDVGVQCPPESGSDRHIVRVTLRVTAGGQLSNVTVPYIVQVKSLNGRAYAKQRLERQVRFLPSADGVQVTDFFEHRFATNGGPLIYEVGLDP